MGATVDSLPVMGIPTGGNRSASADAGISIAVECIHFLDGSVEELGPTEIIVVVGPNSAGKSQFLKELLYAVQNYPAPPQLPGWIREIEFERYGTREQFDSWFLQRAKLYRLGPEPHYAIFQANGAHLTLEGARAEWEAPHFGNIESFMVKYLGARDRGNIPLNDRPLWNPTESPMDPIHYLGDSFDDEVAFSNLIEHAFGFGVSMNRNDRRSSGLFKGAPRAEFRDLIPKKDALDWYANLRPLNEEGDGVRAFVGVLLEAVAGRPLITFIDEPETFLHPRQAKLIGRYLVEETVPSGQIFIATHSTEVLQGILDARGERSIKIIRLDPTPRRHRILPPDRVRRLWSDPLLRYSQMLDGLFHRGLIMCEADNDSRFYEAHLDAYFASTLDHDLIVTHLDGKSRFAAAVADLRGFGVPSAVIGDIDVLREPSKLRELVEAAGGEFAEIDGKIKAIHDEVQGMMGAPTIGALHNVVTPLLKRRPESAISDDECTSIRDTLKPRSGWRHVKAAGLQALPNTAGAAMEILDFLQSHGIFLVPCGELESWYIGLGTRKGAPYVTKVLEERRHENPPSHLRDFLEQIAAYFKLA